MANVKKRVVDFKEGNEVIKNVARNWRNYNKEFKNDMEDILIAGAIDIREYIIESMRITPKASYGFKRGDKTHYPSKKGNPPAIDSGELVRSITFDARKFVVEIGADKGAPYAKILEDKKGKNRPWLQPAIDIKKFKIKMAILNRINKERNLL